MYGWVLCVHTTHVSKEKKPHGRNMSRDAVCAISLQRRGLAATRVQLANRACAVLVPDPVGTSSPAVAGWMNDLRQRSVHVAGDQHCSHRLLGPFLPKNRTHT